MLRLIYLFIAIILFSPKDGFSSRQDTTPPTFTWISPKLFSVLTTDTIRLSIEAHDNKNGSGIQKAIFYVKYFMDKGFSTEKHVIGEDDTFPYEFLWDCSDIPDQNLHSPIRSQEQAHC